MFFKPENKRKSKKLPRSVHRSGRKMEANMKFNWDELNKGSYMAMSKGEQSINSITNF